MSRFSSTVESFWQSSFSADHVIFSSDALSICGRPDLGADRQLMLLETAAGKLLATMTPALVDRLGLYVETGLSPDLLRRKLQAAGITLHGADYVFYFDESVRQDLLQERQPVHVRQLSEADEAVFAEFQANASERDLDDAYVELDHWAVFGAFKQGRLVCAASMYPWDEQQIADMGVLTLPLFRGQGHARSVVRAISRHAYAQGYEPQFRCQLDNTASAALAKASGFSLYGTWDVMAPGSDE